MSTNFKDVSDEFMIQMSNLKDQMRYTEIMQEAGWGLAYFSIHENTIYFLVEYEGNLHGFSEDLAMLQLDFDPDNATTIEIFAIYSARKFAEIVENTPEHWACVEHADELKK